MTRTIAIALAGACLSAAPALAQDVFNGTWKGDISTVRLTAKPDQFAIAGGVYSCASCTPAYSLPADGRPHKVAGHDYFDSKSVEVVDAKTVRFTNLRAGRPVGTATWTVSGDGDTLNQSFSSTDSANGQTISGSATETRLAPAPTGAHAISGSWAAAPATRLSDNAMTVTIQATGKAVSISFPTGEHFTAIPGGPYVPVIGDPSGQMAAVRMTDPTTLELSYKHRGMVDEVVTLVAAPAGNTAAMTSLDRKDGSTTRLTLRKQ